LDTLRFRTDSRLNQVVREVAAGIKRGGLVDLATEVAQASPLGIPGDDLLYEHVHLNFHGTYLAARALFPRISRDLVDRGRVIRYVGEPISEREMRQVLGYNVHEQTMIALELVQRFERPPFTEQSDNAQRLFSWSERAERGQEVLARPQVLAALKAGAAQALQRFPDDWVLRRNTGAMLVARGDAESALPLLETVDAFIDDDVDTLMALGLAYRAVGDGEEAKATFARVRGLEPNYPGIPEHPALPELEGEEL
jgi:tetratricopeptide (TPR) repeat protein